jgi:inorganic pyrophosphatase
MPDWMNLPPRAAQNGLVHVIVDTPKGSRNKYKFDEELGLFKLSRVLPAGMSFPADFGWVPSTRAEDGDAVDVLILTEAPLFVGCLVTVKLLGVIRASQVEKRKKIRNDRLIGALVTPVNEAEFQSLEDVHAERLQHIEHFFRSYNEAQGREFKITGRAGPREAESLLKRAIKRHADERQP